MVKRRANGEGDVCQCCLWQMKRAKRSGSRLRWRRKYLERPGSAMRQQAKTEPIIYNGSLQISRINGEVVEAPLKTKNAYRTLPLAADTIDVLKMQRKKTNGSEWVFPAPDSVLHKLHRVLKRAGLPEVRFHDLRHTFATLALQNGVDIKTVSGMLGHFSAGFTLDTYAQCDHHSAESSGKYHEWGTGWSSVRWA